MILAWESQDARENAGPAGWIYKDRPVRKPRWTKLRDHPVPGLAIYEEAEAPGE